MDRMKLFLILGFPLIYVYKFLNYISDKCKLNELENKYKQFLLAVLIHLVPVYLIILINVYFYGIAGLLVLWVVSFAADEHSKLEKKKSEDAKKN